MIFVLNSLQNILCLSIYKHIEDKNRLMQMCRKLWNKNARFKTDQICVQKCSVSTKMILLHSDNIWIAKKKTLFFSTRHANVSNAYILVVSKLVNIVVGFIYNRNKRFHVSWNCKQAILLLCHLSANKVQKSFVLNLVKPYTKGPTRGISN